MPTIVNPLGLVCTMIGFCELKCWMIGASVKAFLRFRNASSASWVHSHFRKPCVFSKFDMGAVTFAYFRKNLREKFRKPRSTCKSRTHSGVGQSSIVDIRCDSMPIPSEWMTYRKKPTSRTLNRHFSGLNRVRIPLGVAALLGHGLRAPPHWRSRWV